MEGWHLCRSAKGTLEAEGVRVELTRLIARLFSRQLPSPVGLPFRSSGCGGRNRTCEGAVNSRLPVPTQAPPQSRVGVVGFEPTISGFRRRRISRLSYTPIKSARRELNPHLRRGIAVRCRYITGAQKNKTCRLVKEHSSRAPGGSRTLVAALRVRSRGLWTTSASYLSVVQWDQRGSNPHSPG